MPVPNDYLERVYAGVLGKLIGVYLGRPFEGWTYQRIIQELGPIEYYVHERLNQVRARNRLVAGTHAADLRAAPSARAAATASATRR